MNAYDMIDQAAAAVSTYGARTAATRVAMALRAKGDTVNAVLIERVYIEPTPAATPATPAPASMSSIVSRFVDDPVEAMTTLLNQIDDSTVKGKAASDLLMSVLENVKTIEIAVFDTSAE